MNDECASVFGVGNSKQCVPEGGGGGGKTTRGPKQVQITDKYFLFKNKINVLPCLEFLCPCASVPFL